MRLITVALITVVCGLFLSSFDFTNESKGVSLQYKVKMKKITCLINPLWSTNYTCTLRSVSWDRSIIDAVVYLIKPFSTIIARIELYKFSNQFRPFFLNVTADICKWFESKNRQNIYSRIFLNMLTKFSNINHSCPFKGKIQTNGFYFEPQLAKYVVPPGSYMLVLTLFTAMPGTQMVVVNVVGDVEESRRRRTRSNGLGFNAPN